MANALIEQLCTTLRQLSGSELAEKASKTLTEHLGELMEYQFSSLMSSLSECIGLAPFMGVSLPVSEYAEDYFAQAQLSLARGAEQAGLGYGTVPGVSAPVVGIYWQAVKGNEASNFYVIQLKEPEPPALTHDSLVALFADIARAIRAKTGKPNLLIADQFPQAIAAIPTASAAQTTNNSAQGESE
ncbi:hypothetical protein [uncultured Flavonifractor sp.]|uniref:hypothetical protein n=1 Tax=uncultured Flavonifractor sp. TaxID=1193534 RepID=UPI00263109D4|nr:hypothetical protein [uncultured Flavonifractor sp.]